MLTTGRFIHTDEAKSLGLINRAVPGETLAQSVQEMADVIASKLPAAVKIGKEAFYEQAQLTTEAAYRYAGSVMVQNMLDRDTDEGINAFIEKRKPDWAAPE